MFNNNSMGDAGNGLALIKADFGEHGTGGDKKDFFPLSADNAWKDEGCQNSGRTSASTASGMGILCIIVKDQKPAVIVAGRDEDIFFAEKIKQDPLSDSAEVSGDDGVVIRRLTLEVGQMARNSVACGRSHASAHVQGITKSKINHGSGGDSGDHSTSVLVTQRGCIGKITRKRRLVSENAGSASGHCPGCGQGTLVAVPQRKTKFFFGSSKVTGSSTEYV